MFARNVPERAYEARDIKAEQFTQEREQLLSAVAVLIEAMDKTNYESELQWQLAMTLVRGNARKLLRRYGYSL